MTESLTTAEVLNRAADLIEKRGWTTGDGWPGTNASERLCLEGGIAAALGIVKPYTKWSDEDLAAFDTCPAYVAVRRYLEWSFSLYIWNDEPGRTAEEVIAVLRAAALLESTREQVRILHGPTAADALLAKHGQVRA